MAKKFQHLCASARIMRPICQHLSFEKMAICTKKVAILQDGIELGPADKKACPHFLAIGAKAVETKEVVVETDSEDEGKKRKKKEA